MTAPTTTWHRWCATGPSSPIARGNGWFRDRLGWASKRALYGDRLAGLAQLEATFADGHRQRIMTAQEPPSTDPRLDETSRALAELVASTA